MKLRLNVTSFCIKCLKNVLCEGGGDADTPCLHIPHFKWFRREMCAKSAARTAAFCHSAGLRWSRLDSDASLVFFHCRCVTPPPPLILAYLLLPAKNMITWFEMHEESCGARLLTIILIIPTGAWTRTARNLKKKKKNASGRMDDAGSMNAWVIKNKCCVFFSALKCTVWNSPLPKRKWAVSTSHPKKTAAAPTAMNTLTRTVLRRSHWAGETGFQICLNTQKY